MVLTERRKMDRKQNDDGPKDFEAVAIPNKDSLHRYAFRLTKNTAEAEDLVQRTLIQAFTCWHTFRSGQGRTYTVGNPALPWLCSILRNTFFNDCRRQKRKHGRDLSLNELSEDGGIASRCIRLTSAREAATPEGAIMAKEEFMAIRRAIYRLPRPYALVLSMVVNDGLAYGEVASRLGLPLGTVRSRLHRARKRIQRDISGWMVDVV